MRNLDIPKRWNLLKIRSFCVFWSGVLFKFWFLFLLFVSAIFMFSFELPHVDFLLMPIWSAPFFRPKRKDVISSIRIGLSNLRRCFRACGYCLGLLLLIPDLLVFIQLRLEKGKSYPQWWCSSGYLVDINFVWMILFVLVRTNFWIYVTLQILGLHNKSFQLASRFSHLNG